MEMDVDDGPSQFDTSISTFLEISKDRLTVKYTGIGRNSHDVGCLRSDRAFAKTKAIGYFEVYINDSGLKCQIGVGIAPKDYPGRNRQPGWEEGTYGFMAEDGNKCSGTSKGESWGEQGFGAGDVIGCGLVFAKQELFFTRNGRYLGVAFRRVKGEFYPTVGLHSPGDTATINFGQRPFKFDVDAMAADLKDRVMSEVNAYAVHVGDVNALIRGYLLHYGYEDTLRCFEAACGGTVDEQALRTLQNRKRVRRAILGGEIEEALKLVAELYPMVQARDPQAIFMLQCQQFVELIKRRDVVGAIEFARTVLSHYRLKLEPGNDAYLQDILGLLAYDDPTTSPIKRLLEVQQRELVADALNKAILALEHKTVSQSALEALLRQLLLCMQTLRDDNGGRGEVFRLDA